MKRLLDIALALALLTVLALPMVIVALAIRIASPGPALYWSDRVGRDGRLFRMPKFRTMQLRTPEVATDLLADPQRYITRTGHFLRSTSLDELPQLWSIVVGHMSFVGPRPALHNQDDLIAARRELGIDVLRPGLTGWAQVNGRDELSLERKVALDHEYLMNRTLLHDVRIMLLTARRAVKGSGIRH